MIKTLINNHLEQLIQAKEKNIGAERLEGIRPRLRSRISLIQNPMKISSNAWNVILKSEKLLDFVNQNKKASEDVVADLVTADRNIEEIERAVQFPMLNEIYEVVDKTISEYRQSYYCGSRPLNSSDVFLDAVLYSMENGYSPDKIANVTKSFVILYNKGKMEQYDELGKDRINYLSFIQLPYTQDLFDPVGHYKDQKENAVFFQLIYDKVGRDVFSQIYRPIQKSLKQSKQPDGLKEMLQTILNHSRAKDWLLQLCPSTKDILLEREIRKLAQSDSDEENAYTIIYGEDSPQYHIFNTIQDSDFAYLRVFIKKCIMNKKKAFIRLVSENLDAYRMFSESNILFKERFVNIVNLNTLNESNLESLSKMYDEEKLNRMKEDITLTFKEFEYLYQQKETIDMEIFYELMDLSVDERLRACRELPSLKPLLDSFEYDDLVQKVVRLLRVKPMKKWLADKDIHVKNANDIQRLFVILVPEKFEKFQSEIQTGADIEFIIKNQSLLRYAENLDQAKAIYISEDDDCQFMLEDIGLSQKFIKANQSNIVSFCERGLAHVYRTIHKHRKMSEAQLVNLRLITKAELAGKLEEIKFVDEDFELEIGLAISDKAKSEWKHNRSLTAKGFTIQEAYDYETTIRIGENPVRSCLHWDNGMYSRCLLSHFDTNKKIMIAKDSKDRIAARASLRLTKGLDKYIEVKNEFKANSLSFKDIDGEEINAETRKEEVKEELILFLEKCYTSLDGSQARVVNAKFIQLAQEKARELGAKLVVADDYSDEIRYDANLVRKDYYIFISYSKNGYQYLDSLTGQATESNEGHYRRANVFVQESDEEREVA